MRMSLPGCALGAALLSFAIAACGGSTVTTVPPGAQGPGALNAPGERAPAAVEDDGAAGGDGSPTCTAADEKVPGTYASLFAFGIVSKRNKFKLDTTAGHNEFIVSSYAKATPPPTPSPTPKSSPTPTPIPTTTPTPVPVYLYIGNYTVAGGTKYPTAGCFFIETTVDHQPIFGKDNALSSGAPIFKEPVTATVVTSGTIKTLIFTKLTAKGATGTFSLSDGSSGTVTLNGRLTAPDARVRDVMRGYGVAPFEPGPSQ